jgi:FMN reductase [NAD(P)H]
MNEMQKEALTILKNRYSHRKFIDKPIEEEVLNEILEVGLAAASGGNLQPVSIIKIKEKERKQKVANLCNQGFIKDADTLLIFVVDYFRLKQWAHVQKAPFGREQAFRDFIIAMEDVMCMAQSIECAANLLGVGNVYIGTVNARYDEMKELLSLPELTIPVLITCLGYSDDRGMNRIKLSKDVVVHDEIYTPLTEQEVKEKIVEYKYNNWIQELNGDVLEKYIKHFRDVATEVNGEKWAEKVVDKIKEQGGINRAQYRFGWHYNPIVQRSYNEKIYEFYKKQGFKFLPSKEDEDK